MGASDKLLGGAMLGVAAFVFVYYTTWALFLPFVSPDSALQALFPPRFWVTAGPALLLLVGLAGIGAFFAKVAAAEARKKAQAGKKV
ncbi:Dolichol phosphate-mannose biosynthesis regulatory protein [Vanrija albida]|uniref:Dolichol phosphate-mannose biosynthesis regulatory protein n=1 Tax=Vanrija albida TaxID=181172 RepID=A0ABR3QAH7_9TREE